MSQYPRIVNAVLLTGEEMLLADLGPNAKNGARYMHQTLGEIDYSQVASAFSVGTESLPTVTRVIQPRSHEKWLVGIDGIMFAFNSAERARELADHKMTQALRYLAAAKAIENVLSNQKSEE